MIICVHHAQITIPRGAEPEAREFYCGLLGLSEIEKPAVLKGRGGFWLSVGDDQVHVGTEDNVDRQATKAHIAYEVNSLADFRRRFNESGIEIHDGIQIPGYERFEIRDPFGNRLEFLQRI
ncbi:MAG: glyoxalase [Acidobacteria bacterium 13_1_20CM_3_53_8]|nr:MAG: glyoxalase [Acidobacteria bacterium 13_1_20CM_3_53_8]